MNKNRLFFDDYFPEPETDYEIFADELLDLYKNRFETTDVKISKMTIINVMENMELKYRDNPCNSPKFTNDLFTYFLRIYNPLRIINKALMGDNDITKYYQSRYISNRKEVDNDTPFVNSDFLDDGVDAKIEDQQSQSKSVSYRDSDFGYLSKALGSKYFSEIDRIVKYFSPLFSPLICYREEV